MGFKVVFPLLLKSKPVADSIKNDLKVRIEKLKSKGIYPKLTVILVGSDPASEIYVNNKTRVFKKEQCQSDKILFPVDVSENEIMLTIEKLNKDPDVHGILIQLPLPKILDQTKILNSISACSMSPTRL